MEAFVYNYPKINPYDFIVHVILKVFSLYYKFSFTKKYSFILYNRLELFYSNIKCMTENFSHPIHVMMALLLQCWRNNFFPDFSAIKCELLPLYWASVQRQREAFPFISQLKHLRLISEYFLLILDIVVKRL